MAAVTQLVTGDTAFSDDGPVRDHTIKLVQDTSMTYPELWLETYVVGPYHEVAPFPEWLSRLRCTKAESADAADLVIFAGGADVNPALYGEKPHATTYFNEARDEEDIKLFDHCRDNGIPMLGICRGAQFLAVMHGAKLYQDVDNHNSDHAMYDRRNNTLVRKVSSVHHQMVQKCAGMEVIAEAHKSSYRWEGPGVCNTQNGHKDIEAFFFRDTCSLGIQGHPEYPGYHEFAIWAAREMEHFFNFNPDLTSKGKFRRIKTEILEKRKALNLAPYIDDASI